jgi:hypothetical protein
MLYLQHKVKKTREFRKYGQSLMKVTYFNKRLWNICGCDSLIIEFPITSDSIINYFPHIVITCKATMLVIICDCNLLQAKQVFFNFLKGKASSLWYIIFYLFDIYSNTFYGFYMCFIDIIKTIKNTSWSKGNELP